MFEENKQHRFGAGHQVVGLSISGVAGFLAVAIALGGLGSHGMQATASANQRDQQFLANVVVGALSEEVFGEHRSLPTSAALPVRLKIPKIHVDAPIEYVGLTDEGAMDVPKDTSQVGWFAPGTRPGQKGSAVIAGHYGRNNKKASVFDALYQLRRGDRLSIEDELGGVMVFVVSNIRRYDSAKKTKNMDEIFSSTDDQAHVNLITCEGAWDEATQQYNERLVVFADRVNERNP